MSRPIGTDKEKMSARSFEEKARLYADEIENDAALQHKLLTQVKDGYDRPPLALENAIEIAKRIMKSARIIKD